MDTKPKKSYLNRPIKSKREKPPRTKTVKQLEKEARLEAETKQKKKLFLEALEITGNVSESSKTAGWSRRTPYAYKAKDPEFSEDWDHALQKGADALIEEARRRAYEGVEEPVFYKGAEIAKVRKYSDTLLMFLIKGIRPEYRENYKKTVDGDVNVTFRWKTGNDGDNNPVSTP